MARRRLLLPLLLGMKQEEKFIISVVIFVMVIQVMQKRLRVLF